MNQVSLGVLVASCDEGDLLDECLASVSAFDEVVVFDLDSTDDTVAVASHHGARVVPLPRPQYIERIRSEQLAQATSDWILLLDPDERVPDGWLDAARVLVHNAPSHVSAFWIGYREIAFGVHLEHTRVGAAKIALVRADQAQGRDSETVLPHEALHLAGTVGALPTGLPLIQHVGYRSVSASITKLARYAMHGGVSSAPDGAIGPLTCIKTLWRGVVMSGAYKDGTAGIAVASMSAIGDYLGLLERWDQNGQPPAEPSTRQRLLLGLARKGHRAQWRIRRQIRGRTQPPASRVSTGLVC